MQTVWLLQVGEGDEEVLELAYMSEESAVKEAVFFMKYVLDRFYKQHLLSDLQEAAVFGVIENLLNAEKYAEAMVVWNSRELRWYGTFAINIYSVPLNAPIFESDWYKERCDKKEA